MKNYNYFYFGMIISKKIFLQENPENWEDEVVDGYYSNGGYTAIEIEY